MRVAYRPGNIVDLGWSANSGSGGGLFGHPPPLFGCLGEIVKDTLTGTLEYAGQLVAMGTMGYKHESTAGNGELTRATLSKASVTTA